MLFGKTLALNVDHPSYDATLALMREAGLETDFLTFVSADDPHFMEKAIAVATSEAREQGCFKVGSWIGDDIELDAEPHHVNLSHAQSSELLQDASLPYESVSFVSLNTVSNEWENDVVYFLPTDQLNRFERIAEAIWLEDEE